MKNLTDPHENDLPSFEKKPLFGGGFGLIASTAAVALGLKDENVISRKPNSPFFEKRFLLFGIAFGLLASSALVALGLIGILTLPFSFGFSIVFVLVAIATFASLGKYTGRGLDSFIKADKFTNQRLAALIGVTIGLALAILIIFFPFLSIVPLGIIGVMGAILGLPMLAPFLALPNMLGSAADKYGQFIDWFTSKTIFDGFRWLKNKILRRPNEDNEDYELGEFKQEQQRKKAERINEDRGLALGLTLGIVIALAAVVFFAMFFPFTVPTLALFIATSAIFVFLFPPLFCVPFKYAGRASDLFRTGAHAPKPTNQRIAALVGFIVGIIIVPLEILGFKLEFINSQISSLFTSEDDCCQAADHTPSSVCRIFDSIGPSGMTASLSDKIGHGGDLGQKDDKKKITIITLFKSVSEHFKHDPSDNAKADESNPLLRDSPPPSSSASSEPLPENNTLSPKG